MKKWVYSELDKTKMKMLAEKYGLPSFTAVLLTIRGLTEQKDIEEFFDTGCTLPDPFEIKDMDKAVRRIKEAVKNGEKICVYGDYDCDGVTSTALLYSYLSSMFANVMYYIPDRISEGYGMNINAVDKLSQEGVNLIVTVDNGISAIDEIYYAGKLNIDVVVTDHHTPQDILPKACAVVDPHRLDDNSPFKDYCGAGLALMLAIALEGSSLQVVENYSELAAFGTIADLVPLCSVNRTIVSAGLNQIVNTERQGIADLIDTARIDKISAGNIAFRLAPRINAAGRLGSPYDALELLLTEDEDRSRELAEKLSELNSRRQSIENDIYDSICEKLNREESLTFDRVLVVSGTGWNAGVIGIVASKITEKYGKPCIIISEDDELCKASGRSVQGFSLVDAIFACSEYLEKFGGHPMAAGLSIKKENIVPFRKAINDYADKLDSMPLMPMKIDCKLNPDTIVTEMVHQLSRFEPFGYGNPKPVFGINNMLLEKIIPMSGGKHIKLCVSRGNARLSFMKFSTTPEEFPYTEGTVLDFAVALDINIYQQKEYLSFSIRDIKPSNFETAAAMLEEQLYDRYKKGVLCPELKDKYPTRDEFAAVYRYIKKTQRRIYTVDSILSALGSASIGAFKLLIIFDIMKELQLVRYSRAGDDMTVELLDSPKVDLNSSEIYKRLKEDTSNV